MLGNFEIEIDYNTFIVNMFIQKHLIHINVKSKLNTYKIAVKMVSFKFSCLDEGRDH